jgi:hypothetical protein
MPTSKSVLAACVGFAALLGCEQSSGIGVSGVPGKEEQACLRAVAAETNVADVVLIGSSQSGSGTNVTVGVGPSRVRWSCIGHPDGTTSRPIKQQGYGIL